MYSARGADIVAPAEPSGWALITVLTALLDVGVRWWALLSAGVLVLVGGVVVQAMALVGRLWPLLLVGASLYLLFCPRAQPVDDAWKPIIIDAGQHSCYHGLAFTSH